jgi:superfamily II DNA helicase RecQ
MIKIVTVPFDEMKKCFIDEGLDRFTANKIIKRCEPRFFSTTNGAYWSVFFEYEIPSGLENEENDFSEAEKLLYDRLRVWRKDKAEQKGFPVYVICNNSQLKTLVKLAPKTVEALKNIDGFGKRRLAITARRSFPLSELFLRSPYER